MRLDAGDLVEGRCRGRAGRQLREPFLGEQQPWCREHGQRDDHIDDRGDILQHDAHGDGDAGQHEGELAALREGAGKPPARGAGKAVPAAERAQHEGLEDHQAGRAREDETGPCRQNGEIERHADRDEEQAEKQHLERPDVGLDLVPVG
jgi:hypothetical protein